MIREELLAIMDQAAREGWTELDLRDKKIVELPGGDRSAHQIAKVIHWR